jgi:hypothetical protein
VEDLLAAAASPPEVRPCPVCVLHGTQPPGRFLASECRLRLDEGDRARLGAVTCPACRRAGRPGLVRVMDVAPPEVFASYNWGAALGGGLFSTQELARVLLRRVEEAGDVMCWLDVEGGMGAGQDQLAEMRRGVRRAAAVVVLLSDAYVNSDNCKREFLHAARGAKYLIPVLVPDVGLAAGRFAAGWTGAGPAAEGGYWRHAERVCESPQDPDDPTAVVDWSYLARFAPLVLPAPGADGEPPVALVDEIVQRVLSRLQRGAAVPLHEAAELLSVGPEHDRL